MFFFYLSVAIELDSDCISISIVLGNERLQGGLRVPSGKGAGMVSGLDQFRRTEKV